ncbi:hypothetical protein Tco_0790885 [Tanacetum coccineum]
MHPEGDLLARSTSAGRSIVPGRCGLVCMTCEVKMIAATRTIVATDAKESKEYETAIMNNFNALKSTFQRLSNSNLFGYNIHSSFQYEFGRLCGEEFNTFKSALFHNMDNLEKLLNKELLHEKDSKSALSMIKVQFDKFMHSEVLKPSNYDSRHIREIFKEYTRMEPQSFKDLIIQYMEFIENCIWDSNRKGNANGSNNDCNTTGNDQSSWKESNTSGNKSSSFGNECSERSNSGNDTDIRPSYDTEPMVEVQNNADYNVFAVKKQHTEKPEFINDTYVIEKNDSNVTSDSTQNTYVRKCSAAKRGLIS